MAIDDADRACALEEHAVDQGVGAHRQTIAQGPQVGDVAASAILAFVAHRLVAQDTARGAAQVAVVEVFAAPEAAALGGGDGGFTPLGLRARSRAKLAFERVEVGRDVVPAPAFGPLLVVEGGATGVDHRVDRAAPPEATPGAGEEPSSSPTAALHGEAIPEQRVVDEGLLVAVRAKSGGMTLGIGAGLQEEDAAVAAGLRGDDATGRSATDHDQIEVLVHHAREFIDRRVARRALT